MENGSQGEFSNSNQDLNSNNGSDQESELDEFEIGGQGSRRRRKSRKSKKNQQNQQQQQKQQQKQEQNEQKNQKGSKKKLNINLFDIDQDDFGGSTFGSQSIEDSEQQQQQQLLQQQEQQQQQLQIQEEVFAPTDLEFQLYKAQNYKEFKQTVEDYTEKFTFQNAIACLSELAWIVSRSEDPEEIQNVRNSPELKKMTEIVFQDQNNIRGSDTAIALWSLTRLNYLKNNNYFQILNQQVELDISNFGARYISLILYSYAKLNKFPENPQIVFKLYKQAKKKIDDFEPQGLSNVLWALTILGGSQEMLKKALIQKSEEKIQKFEAQGLGILIYCVATLQFQLSEQFLEQICQVSIKKIDDFNPQGMAMLIWGFSKLGYYDEYLINQIGNMIKSREFLFKPADLNMLCCGFAGWNYSDLQVWQILEKQTRVFFYNEDLSLEETAGLMWSFAAIQYYPQDLLEDGLIASLGDKLQFCGPQELQNIMWSITKLRIPITSETVQIFVRCGLRNLKKMKPSMISTIASSLSQMQTNSKLKKRLANQLVSRAIFKDFSPQEFCNLVLASSKMGIPLYPYEKELEQYIFAKIKRFQPADFAMIFYSMGKNKEFYFSYEFFDLFMWYASTWTPKMIPQEICCVAFGCAGRNLKMSKTLVMTIGLHVSSKIEEYQIGDIGMLLFNLGRLEQSPGEFALQQLDKRAAELFKDALPRDIAAISKGFAMLSFYPKNFIVKLQNQWQQDASRFEIRESEAIQISLERFNQLLTATKV